MKPALLDSIDTWHLKPRAASGVKAPEIGFEFLIQATWPFRRTVHFRRRSRIQQRTPRFRPHASIARLENFFRPIRASFRRLYCQLKKTSKFGPRVAETVDVTRRHGENPKETRGVT